AGGMNYQVGDDISTVVSGADIAATFKVATLGAGGAVATLTLTAVGKFATAPSNPVATTGGHGSGLTLNLATVNSLLERSERIRLSVSPAGSHPVYAAFIGFDGRVWGFLRSADQGANWAKMDLPGEPDAATVTKHNINTSGQGDIHFSIAADPA